MGVQGYGQFCPVAMTAEILGSRWTVVLLRELIAGSTRFNDLRKGVSRMSPTLLSKRLRELEQFGIIERTSTRSAEYRLTDAGRDLKLVVDAFGIWGQRWMSKEVALQNLDPFLLMLDMKRNVDPGNMPKKQAVIHIRFPELSSSRRRWWLIVEGADVEITQQDPSVDPDLTVESSLAVLTEIWMGLTTVRKQVAQKTLRLSGDRAIADTMQSWLGLSPFAPEPKRAA
ncbi:MAG TPA: helix-turn-helix domain-containing protein [Bauldia sp.]|nr:helix-turn-helix domain-containing protein [Bauldia sp.]